MSINGKSSIDAAIKGIGYRIKKERVARKLTQKELAQIAEVTDRAVSKWERGEAAPDLAIIALLSEYFNVSIDYLVLGKEKVIPKTYSKSISPILGKDKFGMTRLEGVLIPDDKDGFLRILRNMAKTAGGYVLGQVIENEKAEIEAALVFKEFYGPFEMMNVLYENNLDIPYLRATLSYLSLTQVARFYTMHASPDDPRSNLKSFISMLAENYSSLDRAHREFYFPTEGEGPLSPYNTAYALLPIVIEVMVFINRPLAIDIAKRAKASNDFNYTFVGEGGRQASFPPIVPTRSLLSKLEREKNPDNELLRILHPMRYDAIKEKNSTLNSFISKRHLI